MGYYLNKGNAKFLRYMNNKIFIDKSLLIKECNEVLNSEESYMCITRPRRFGKTMALSMLNAYYSKGCDSKEIFSSLKISNDLSFETHLNKYNVVLIDMASLFTGLDDEIEYVNELNRLIVKDIEEYFPNILTDEEDKASKAIKKVFEVKKEKFIFLIDEWDVVLRESNDNKLKDDYINFLRSLFKSLDTSECIDLVYMTGILPIKRYRKKESALNNFREYTMLESYPISEYIGFTESEVKELCDEYNMDYNEMKLWYDGYNLDGVQLYNPKSVVEALTLKKIKNYWVSTSSLESAKEYLRFKDKELRLKLTNMLTDNSVSVSVRGFDNDISILNNSDDVLTLLIHLGYLTYNYDTKECYIPNYEIKCELEEAFEKLEDADIYEVVEDSIKAVKALFNSDGDSISEILDKNHELYCSALNKNNEQALELLTIFSFYTLRTTHTIEKEKQNTKGRADIVCKPKKEGVGIIIELKYNKTASLAIEQAKKRNYPSLLDGYIGKVILCGINYDDDMNHSTIIEVIDKIK